MQINKNIQIKGSNLNNIKYFYEENLKWVL